MAKNFKKSLIVLFLVVLSLFLAAFVAMSLYDSPEYARRLLAYGESDINDYLIFPERPIQKDDNISVLETADVAFPQSVVWSEPAVGQERTENLEELFQRTDTRAFIAVQDDVVIYEGYFNGSRRDSINTSFSTAKSFNSALIGAALTEGNIESVHDPVIKYIPEIAGRGLDALTLRDLLMMSTGIRYRPDSELPFILRPFGDAALTYYSPDLRRTALRVEPGDMPPGKAFWYNNYHPLLEGMILERVTGMSVAEYLQEKIWQPMGAEYPASWSLDSEASGFEKMESGINARAIDFARFGLIFLHDGFWNGVQILPGNWVREATTPQGALDAPIGPGIDSYYKYHWWGLRNADGAYDFYAAGHFGQFIYVAPRKNVVIVRLGGESDSHPIIWPLMIQSLVDQME